MCLPAYREGYWVSVISPVWVVIQIAGLSGIPLQEKQAKVRIQIVETWWSYLCMATTS